MCYIIPGDSMKKIGIIAEYNPFHNGHLYQINEIKKIFPDSLIIVILSGNFTQKGDISIINKWDKTNIALNYVDLVIENPFCFCTESADIFAYSSISILKELKVDYLVFGSESNNIDILYKLANTQINNKEFDYKVKYYLDLGFNYPNSLAKALKELTSYEIKEPNDILGITYIKEIINQKADIIPHSIKRTNDYNSLELNDKIVSASAIRNGIKNNKNINKYIPNYKINNPHFIDEYFTLLKYKILTTDDLSIYQSVDEGIEFRIKKYINESNNLEELIDKCKTKRYTYNRIKRMFLHILCNFTKKEAKNRKISYIRVLGFNSKGKNYLNKIKKDVNLPILTKYNDSLYIEKRVTDIYNLITNGIEEHKNKIIKKD